MIVLLTFAPIEFMGGVERSFYHLFITLNESEQTKIISVNPIISNLYSRLVLKRKFDRRVDLHKEKERQEIIDLTFKHFIPFSSHWFEIRNLLTSSRVIYFKFELIEVFILLYFVGASCLKKTIASIRSPLTYSRPCEFFDYIHNIVYKSFITKVILSNVKLIHVMNIRDKIYLEHKLKFSNIIHIPNGISIQDSFQSNIKHITNTLKIVFVGELTIRKGIDILYSIIENSPKHFRFNIVGDGNLKFRVHKLVAKFSNCKYFSYQQRSNLDKIYQESDVLFLPSRAETFGTVMIEGMKHGLKIVNSQEISLNLPKDIEYSSKTTSAREYIKLFDAIYLQKRNNLINRKRIHDYCYENFSEEIIDKRLKNELFMKNT